MLRSHSSMAGKMTMSTPMNVRFTMPVSRAKALRIFSFAASLALACGPTADTTGTLDLGESCSADGDCVSGSCRATTEGSNVCWCNAADPCTSSANMERFDLDGEIWCTDPSSGFEETGGCLPRDSAVVGASSDDTSVVVVVDYTSFSGNERLHLGYVSETGEHFDSGEVDVSNQIVIVRTDWLSSDPPYVWAAPDGFQTSAYISAWTNH